MRLSVCAAVAVSLCGLCMQTHAGTVVDADAFAAGTVLDTAYPGVTLSALGSYGGDGSVYALASGTASTPPNVFGNNWGTNPLVWGFDASFQPHLRVDFDYPAAWVSIDAIGNNSEDYGRLEAYSAADVLLDADETGLIQIGDVETMTVSGPGIAYVLAAGVDPGQIPHHTVQLDRLEYEPVPEPATLILLSLGATGVFHTWRRRKT